MEIPVLRISDRISVDETELSCGICMGIFNKPSLIIPCGHSFCKECIETSLRSDNRCPMCRLQITDTVMNGHLQSLINKLVVAHCPDCDWSGTLDEFEKYKTICKHVKISCPYSKKGCQERLTGEQMQDHNKVCEFRYVECPYCECNQIKSEYENHLIICLKRPKICEFCDESVPYDIFQSHIRTDCPKILVKCPNCEEEVEKYKLLHHKGFICVHAGTEKCKNCGRLINANVFDIHRKRCKGGYYYIL